MKYTIFWDVTPSRMVEVHQCFGGTYCLHIQSKEVMSKKRAASEALLAGCLLGLLFDPEDGGNMFLRNLITFHK
jgi:hypothetical protein